MKPCSIQSNAPHNPATHRKYVRALRIAAWNALGIILGLLLIALIGEAYFRLTKPFINTHIPYYFVDGVGLIYEPNSELRYAGWRDDNFVVSRVNSQGFLDREPVSAERAAEGCHITFIGDSFVDAWQAPIADKFHVRLEEMAARELPHLDIATQAYGIANTGQINQLPYYDEYARLLNPKLVALVFYFNDFVNNSTALRSLRIGADPDRMPFMSAQRNAHGNMELRPPDPEYEQFLQQPPWHSEAWRQLVQISYLAKWLDVKGLILEDHRARPTEEWADMIAERLCCAWTLDVWRPGREWTNVGQPFFEEHMPPAYEDALAYTDFGIDQFKRRADRDGATLVIMAATSSTGTPGDPQFDRLSAIAEARGIPVISDYDYILRQGYNPEDGILRFDGHWNLTGHQWVAETFLEWLKANQGVCD